MKIIHINLSGFAITALHCTLFIIASLTVQAQTDIQPGNLPESNEIDNENIEVVKEYAPVLADAVKVSLHPNLPTPNTGDNNTKPFLKDYNVPSKFMQVAYQPPMLRPLAFKKTTKDEPLPHFWLTAGFGNFNTPIINVGASTGRSKKGHLGFDVDYIQSESKRNKFKKINQLNTEVFGKLYTPIVALGASGGYKQNKYNYYAGAEPLQNTPTTIATDDLSINYNNINLSLNIADVYETDEVLDYNFTAAFDRFWDKHPLEGTENNYKINGHLQRGIDNEAKSFLGAKLNAHGNAFKRANDTENTQEVSNLALTFTPYYQLRSSFLNATLGGSAILDGDKVTAFPHIEAELLLAPERMHLFGGWHKQAYNNSYQHLANINPFIAPTGVSPFVSLTEERYIGVRGSIIPQLSYSAKFFQNIEDDSPLFLGTVEPLTNTTRFISIAENEIKATGGQLEFGIKVAPYAQITLGGSYRNYETEVAEEAWNKPNFHLNIDADVNLTEKLGLSAQINSYYGAKSIVYNALSNSTTKKDLKGIIDINLDGTYQVLPNLSFFARINNLTGNNFEPFANYYTYDLQALGGFNLRF